MGRIYGTVVRKVGDELIARYPALFNENFEENKEKVSMLLKTESKVLKNKVAGYLTSRIRAANKMKATSAEQAEQPAVGVTENLNPTDS